MISVVIPTYNRRHELERALNSVFAQTHSEWEVVVVDDASDDGTEELVRELASERVQYHRLPGRSGAAAARNVGVELAKGEYIAFLDSDDEWVPRKLEIQVEALEKGDADIDVVYCGMTLCRGAAPPITLLPSPATDLRAALACYNVIGPLPGVVLRLECFNRVGGFNTDLPSCQDWDLWWRLARDHKFCAIRRPLVFVHEDAADRITRTPLGRLRGHRHMWRMILDDIAEENPVLRPRVTVSFYRLFGLILEASGRSRLARRFYCKSWSLGPTGWPAIKAYLVSLVGSVLRARLREIRGPVLRQVGKG